MQSTNDSFPEAGENSPSQKSVFGFEGRPAFSGKPQDNFWNGEGPTIDVTPVPHLFTQSAPSLTPSPKFSENASSQATETQGGHHPQPPAGLVQVRQRYSVNLEDPDFSYDVQELMMKPPAWLLRCGTSIIAAVIGVVLFLSWMIHYPDSISGTMIISGTNPAVQIVARQSGHLEQLLVKEGELVQKGQTLGIIESTAQADQVFALRKSLAGLIPFLSDTSKFQPIEVKTEAQLGQLQTDFSTFLSDYTAFQALLADDYADRTVLLISKQLEHQKERVANMRAQVESAVRAFDLASEKYSRMEKLHARGSLSTSELEDNERALITAAGAKSDITKGLNSEEVSAIDLEKQMNDLTHEKREAIRISVAKLQESLKRLLSGIETWEEKYVLRSPVQGRVAFYDFWANTQYVTEGSQVFMVAPESAALVGRMQVKGSGVGKIETGQKVNVKFEDYAFKEFGMVTGEVRSGSLIAREGAHLIIVDLSYPLVTNFGKEIPFKQSMQAQGSIITEDLRLIERVFYELRKAIASTIKSDPQTTVPEKTSAEKI